MAPMVGLLHDEKSFIGMVLVGYGILLQFALQAFFQSCVSCFALLCFLSFVHSSIRLLIQLFIHSFTLLIIHYSNSTWPPLGSGVYIAEQISRPAMRGHHLNEIGQIMPSIFTTVSVTVHLRVGKHLSTQFDWSVKFVITGSDKPNLS